MFHFSSYVYVCLVANSNTFLLYTFQFAQVSHERADEITITTSYVLFMSALFGFVVSMSVACCDDAQ